MDVRWVSLGFDLHFPDGRGCWVLRILLCAFWTFIWILWSDVCEKIQILCPFLYWVYFLLLSCKCSLNIRDISVILYIIYSHFLPCWGSLYLPDGVLWSAKLFSLVKLCVCMYVYFVLRILSRASSIVNTCSTEVHS